MAEPPQAPPEITEFMACPCCTIQIPLGTRICPHCRLEVPEKYRQEAEKDAAKGRKKAAQARKAVTESPAGGLFSAYGKWILAGVPILIALVVLVLVYGRWSGHKVTILPNPELPITVTQEKKDQTVLLRISVTNEGDDITDLSLRSIGVVVEIQHDNGRVQKKTVFPKSDFHGEGALLRGETGVAELRLPAKGIREITLRSEIVDLGAARLLIPPAQQNR